MFASAGHVLGYPPFLVDGYCRDLAAELPAEQKEGAMRRAREELQRHLEASGAAPPRPVAMGAFEDILEQVIGAAPDASFLPGAASAEETEPDR